MIAGVIEIAPDSLFRLYTVSFNGFTSTVELIKLLENIAAMNPVVSITEISIMPVEKAGKHRASFVVAWLIWKDPFNLPDYITKPALLDAEEEALENLRRRRELENPEHNTCYPRRFLRRWFSFVTFGAFAEQAENNSVDNNENSLSEKDAVPFKDPFWPIGFRPISPDEPSPDEITQAVVMEDMWNEALEKISVKGVLRFAARTAKCLTRLLSTTPPSRKPGFAC